MTGIADAELRAQRLITKTFIEADSAEIVLYRSSMVSDGKGGTVRSSPTPLPPQVMRVIPLSQQGGSPERFTADGRAVRPEYMLMAEHDADMERFDTVPLPSGRYEVVFVNSNRQYQTKGELVYRGV